MARVESSSTTRSEGSREQGRAHRGARRSPGGPEDGDGGARRGPRRGPAGGHQGRPGGDHRFRCLREACAWRANSPQPAHRRSGEGEEDVRAGVPCRCRASRRWSPAARCRRHAAAKKTTATAAKATARPPEGGRPRRPRRRTTAAKATTAAKTTATKKAAPAKKTGHDRREEDDRDSHHRRGEEGPRQEGSGPQGALAQTPSRRPPARAGGRLARLAVDDRCAQARACRRGPTADDDNGPGAPSPCRHRPDSRSASCC